MIQIKNLTKKYGSTVAVDDISFSVKEGEILGFLGPNGAGKSTTMNIITGYLSSNEGEVIVDGFNILDNPTEAKKRIGYLPEHPPLYLDMTVGEYLSFMYDLKKVKLDVSKKNHIDNICGLVKISHVTDRVISHLSKGYRQRVGIAQAMLGNPPVLILDEPTVGLDPKQIIEIRSLIKSLSTKHTIVLSSHILSEIQAVCDRVVVINAGKIVADDTESHLSNTLSKDSRIVIRIEGPEQEVYNTMAGIPDVKEIKTMGLREDGIYEYIVEAKPGKDVRREIFKRMSTRSWAIMSLKSSEMTLEDIFLALTDGTFIANENNDTKDGGDK